MGRGLVSSPARAMFPSARRPNPRRAEKLATSTIREFDGGWNAIDNDLNLSTRFAKALENMYRSQTGALALRYGTKLFSDLENQVATTGSLVTDALTTTVSSAVIRVAHVAHGLVSGHLITFAGLVGFDGIPTGELNATHNVTVVTVDTYDITVTTTASAGATGGGAAGTFSHNNKEIAGDIINGEYFQDRIVGVDDAGVVFEIDSNGVSRVVFNTAIAAKLVGSPSAWSATTFVSFAVFGGQLIICNGIDKPLLVDFAVTPPTQPVQYLQDIPAGSNAHTPIARYVFAMDHYVLMAGDPTAVGTIHISNFDTSGTWQGDAAPNDGTTVAIDKVVTSQNFVIRGIGRFRDRAVVALDDNLVLGDLGLYNTDGDHVPEFDDVIEKHGAVGHHTFQTLGNDLLTADVFGVPSLSRALFTGSIQPQRASELVDPPIQKLMLGLSVGSAEDRTFSVYNQDQGQYMLFIPNADTIGGTTETECFVYTRIDTLKIKAWSLFKGWNWSCALRSALGRIFFGKEKKFFVYGAKTDEFFGDLIDDYDKFAWLVSTAYVIGDRVQDPDTSVTYKCLFAHTSAGSGSFAADRLLNPTFWEEYVGDQVPFAWELPWADFDKRIAIKHSRYIGFDTKGKARFTTSMYVDNIFEDKQNPGQLLTPALSMVFVGGDAPGFGGGDQPFGGGRRTSDERLFAWTAKFKIAKIRFTGNTTDDLSFIAITIAYQDGSIRR